jgi:hypothetical protein
VEKVELYVLAASRNSRTARAFLDRFPPNRRPAAEDFPFPEFSDCPDHVYQTPEGVMERLEHAVAEPYAIYWYGEGAGYADQAMLFFTRDAAMIVGLVLPDDALGAAFLDVSGVVGGRFGFITGESAPPETQGEFVRICRESTLTALVDGEVRPGAFDV